MWTNERGETILLTCNQRGCDKPNGRRTGTTMNNFSECWVEAKAAELIGKIKRSQWAESCFADVRRFMAEGYACDVAMAISWGYWGR